MTKPQLTVSVDLGSSDFYQVGFPIEIRKPNLELIGTMTTSQTMDLDPGTYFVSLTLPAGQEFMERVQLQEGQQVNVLLPPDPDDRSPHEWLAIQRFLKGTMNLADDERKVKYRFGTLDLPGVALTPEPPRAKVRGFVGNLLTRKLREMETARWLILQPFPNAIEGQLAKFMLTPNNATQIAQLIQPGRPAWNMAVPVSVSATRAANLVIKRTADGNYDFDVELENVTAELLLQYIAKGIFNQAQIVAAPGAQETLAEQLLDEKNQDPIGAVVGAYALLRLGELERLHSWTQNLKDWFLWLPDGAVIRAEHLMRVGNYTEALAALLELNERGMPFFSDGLSYAIERLTLYLHSRNSRPDAEALLNRLRRFAAFVDFRKPILTFTGLDPSEPDNKPVGPDLGGYSGLSLL